MADIPAAVESRSQTATVTSTARGACWIAATLCIVYGFAKINGSQFTVLDSELSKPLGSVSGFWLTWYYFGYSWLYGTTIAIIQIAAGILLIIPRTSLLGATLLLPLVANIVAIDVLYGVDLGGSLAAFLLLGCVIAIMKPHFDRLRRALILSDAPLRVSTPAAIALPVLIVGAWSFTWWTANYNNCAPTSIDGTWSVIQQSQAGVS